jgi:DNA-binding protein H-NS
MHGWTVRALKDTRELAVVRATKDGQEPVETHWDVEDAIESHRLDAWVEDWRTAERSGKRYAVTYVVRINGEPMTWYGDVRGPLPEPLPKWVQDQVNSGAVKKYDAWWNYRRDMMVKSAMKRACKFAIPHILLGAPENHELPTPYVRPELGFIDADAYEEDEVPPEVYDDLPEANAGEPGTERYDPDDPKRPF